MKMIQTTTGPIEASHLGRTLIHEHFLFGFVGFQGDTTLGGFDEDFSIQENLKAIAKAKSYGIKTIIDATTNECGRNPLFLQKLSALTDIQIICSTGYYFAQESAFTYWRFRSTFSNIEEEIYEMLHKEVTEGIENTNIRAGIIKLASGKDEFDPIEKMFFKSAAKINSETGVPIITHTQEGTLGPEQAKLLIENGANPQDIAIGHMCGNTDPDYHEAILKQGVYDSFDRFGLEGELFQTPTDKERVALILELIKRGWEDKILLGHDAVTVILGRKSPSAHEKLEILRHANWGNIGNRVIPMMQEAGITHEQIEKNAHDQPRFHARVTGITIT